MSLTTTSCTSSSPSKKRRRQQQLSSTMENSWSSSSVTTGAEPHLVGLSPTYWCHVPLLIAQIHTQVALVRGIHCLHIYPNSHDAKMARRSNNEKEDEHANEKLESHRQQQQHVKMIPISKCHLVGTIVSAERKASGAVRYVLDDGTGLMDVLFWIDRYLDELPEIVPLHPSFGGARADGTCSVEGGGNSRSSSNRWALNADVTTSSGYTSVCSVGTLVRVLGSLHSISLEEPACPSSVEKETEEAIHDDTKGSSSGTTTMTSTKNTVDGDRSPPQTTLMYRTMYEIHATQVEPVSFGAEYRHWIKCSRINHPDPSQCNFYNAQDVIKHLGSEMARQIANRQHLPAVDDTMGAWRLFGTQCRCQVEYKDALLYCHCIASIELLDPHFEYRDALLQRLLQMENEQCIRSNKRDAIKSMHTDHLRFHYKTISTDTLLNETAIRTLSTTKASTATSSQRLQSLVTSTFRALRKDGILYLLDADSDTYVLISRAKLLEPYLQAIWSTSMEQVDERAYFRQNPPAYLANVPKARLELAKRLMSTAASSVGEI